MIFKILLSRSVQTPNLLPIVNVCRKSTWMEFIIEQGHRINWVSGSLDSGSLGRWVTKCDPVPCLACSDASDATATAQAGGDTALEADVSAKCPQPSASGVVVRRRRTAGCCCCQQFHVLHQWRTPLEGQRTVHISRPCCPSALWSGGVMVTATQRSWIQFPTLLLSGSNLGQLLYRCIGL